MELLDQLRFEKQGPNLTGRTLVTDALGLLQHPGFVWIAQVRQETAAQVDALANIQRQIPFLAVKNVHAWGSRHIGNRFPQMFRINVCAC